METKLTAEIWTRLLSGRSLEDLELPVIHGCIDLRGLTAPSPSVLQAYSILAAKVTELGNLILVRGMRWKNLDFSQGQLESLRFFDCQIENCSFEGADCRDWRMWGTRITDTSFKSADLRSAALGGIDDGKRNAFLRVDFSRADLRQTAHGSADFVECNFSNTKLKKVDFQGDVFVNCTFAGKLDEVLFYRHAFRGETLPPNEMQGVDFRRARLNYVEFRNLDMVNVKWPEGDEHILIYDYINSLDRVLTTFEKHSDLGSRRLCAVLKLMRKWAGPHQQVGIISKHDLIDLGGEDAVGKFLEICHRQSV